jgi:glycosyltransferase involved in cell wall biosynthesis
MKPLPTISVLTPAYDTTVDLARRLAGSMLAQRAHWEWVVVDDASTDTSGVDEIRRQMGDDPRLKLITHDTNHGIVGATATALAHASGAFVALLDHDDELHPDALAEVTAAIEAVDEVDVIYTDEDKIDQAGRHHELPFFKPDWSPERLRCQMYLGHLLVIRRTLMEAVGGFRVGYDGSQDYDLALRVTEQAGQIHHIPKVLYHCRSAPRSAADRIDTKPTADDAARAALADHAKRVGLEADVVDVEPGVYRLRRHFRGPPSPVGVARRTNSGHILDRVGSTPVLRHRPRSVAGGPDHLRAVGVCVRHRRRHSSGGARRAVRHPRRPFGPRPLRCALQLCTEDQPGRRSRQRRGVVPAERRRQVITPDWLDTLVGFLREGRRRHGGRPPAVRRRQPATRRPCRSCTAASPT